METRLKCRVYEPGLVTGMEIDVTNVLLGLSAETFTIVKCTAVWLGPETPAWDLELGLGEFAAATTGAEDGGPLDYPTPVDVIEHETYDSIADTDSPRSIGSNLPWIFLNMAGGADPSELPAIDIAPGRNAYCWWEPGGAVVIDHDSGGGIVVAQSDSAAWISTNDGVPAAFTIVTDTPEPDYIFCIVGPTYGQTVGGVQTVLP